MRVLRIFTSFSFVIFLLAVFAMPGSVAYAATLLFSPSSGTYSVGDSYSVQVLVSSTDQPINAVSGVITFPQDKLEVSSVSTGSSIVTLWVTQPTFSNGDGTVSFEGIIPNPGFQGADATVLTIDFKVIALGQAPLAFSSASVLANDGQGTNILQNIGSASFSLGNSAGQIVTPPTPTPTAPSGTPSAPTITSLSHPDQNSWYNMTTAQLSWQNSADTIADRLLFGRLPHVTPTVVYKPGISSKEIDTIADGVWYFHVQDENQNGWGAVADFELKVDSTPPDNFVMKEVPRTDSTDPNVQLSLSATDDISGVAYYTVQIDNNDPIKWVDDGSGIYKTDPLSPGDHTILGKAFDAAGNSVSASIDVNVTAIAAPEITSYPQQVKSGDLITVKGTTLPDSTVDVFLGKDSNNPIDNQVMSDDGGNWSTVFDKQLPSGAYTLYAVTTDSRGAKSEQSRSVTIAISVPILFVVGSYALNALVIVVPVLALLFLLMFLVFHATHKLRLMRKSFRKELGGVEHVIDDSFKLLKEDLEDHIRLLERTKTRRTLTTEEEALIKRLRSNIGDIEKVVHKKMDDIDRRFS